MIGRTLGGRYGIVRLLGKGGMGSVYDAKDAQTDQRVAVKLLHAVPDAKGEAAVRRFQREARAASAIDSPHIARTLDWGTDAEAGVPFMVMEYLTGEDLDQLLDRLGPLQPECALKIVAQACVGLQKARDAGVIHRDIKPANLFLARGEGDEITVKVLDFGIAKIKPAPDQAGSTTGLTRTGGLIGSPLYMSPEQARGIKEVGPQTDIWSLGVVLYRALSGRAPLQDVDALGELILLLCSKPPTPLQDVAPWVRPEVAELVHRALQRDPGARFASPSEMLEAIKPLLPEGWVLDVSMLLPVEVQERDTIAPRLGVAEPDGKDGTDDRAMTRSPSGPSPETRSGARSRVAPAAVVAIAAALIGAAVVRLATRDETAAPPVAAVALPAPAETEAPLVAPSATAASAAGVVKTVQLAILPEDASVLVDGVPRMPEGGLVAISGTLGSLHRVKLTKDGASFEDDVIVAEIGASPSKLELAPTPSASASDAPRTAPAPTHRPLPPPQKAQHERNPLIPKGFE